MIVLIFVVLHAFVCVAQHNHEPDASLLANVRVLEEVKQRASTTQETTQNIISAATDSLTPSEACTLPSVQALRKTVQRAKSKSHNAPASPNNLADLEIPEQYAKTSSGAPFLVHDSGSPENGPERILIYASAEGIRMLRESEKWYADGTFKTVPRLFTQLYTIHVNHHGHILPAVYALLPNKQEATYTRMLNALAGICPGISPTSITTDFEHAALNAFRSRFPGARLQGCYFHLSQNIFKHVQHAGLQERYSTDLDFALEVRKLAALAFVPPGDVVDYFELLQDSFPVEAEPVIDYFEVNYIGLYQRNGRRKAAQFPIPLWNVHDATLDQEPRTNNNMEGWHRYAYQYFQVFIETHFSEVEGTITCFILFLFFFGALNEKLMVPILLCMMLSIARQVPVPGFQAL